MATVDRSLKMAASLGVTMLLISAVAMPVAGRKQDPPAGQTKASVAPTVDPGAGAEPTTAPTDGGTPAAGPAMPTLPGATIPDEIGGIIDPARIVQLVQECNSITVAGLAVSAHICKDGIDVVGTLPPDAPFTVFAASKGVYAMAAPFSSTGKAAEITLPYSAEPLAKWVHRKTGIRLRRDR
ncbi:MAG: hypothetical protein ACR2J8_00520 [Thermomicrobiales bacterium]